MRIRVDGTSIKPGESAGVEAFTYGLVDGLATVTSDHIEIEILEGTRPAWQERVRSTEVDWSEIPVALRSDARMGSQLRRLIPGQLRASAPVRRLVNAVRKRARPVPATSADVTLYPFSWAPIQAEPSVLVLHDLRRILPGQRSAGYVEVVRENVRKASAIAVSWPHPFNQVLETFPEARGKTVMIPLPAFHPRPDDAVNDPQGKLLLYPSSTAEHKNHKTLLSAMALLESFKLVCPGPLVEPLATELLRRADKPDLKGRISLPGFVNVSDLTNLYRKAWAVVVPSTWEAASGAIFEAFSWGIPVACADVPPLRAQVEFAGAEVAFFDPLSPEGVAEAVKRVANDYEKFAGSSRLAGRKLADRSWAQTAEDYARLMSWVTSGARGSVPESDFVKHSS